MQLLIYTPLVVTTRNSVIAHTLYIMLHVIPTINVYFFVQNTDTLFFIMERFHATCKAGIESLRTMWISFS
jgi:hypothetical protein